MVRRAECDLKFDISLDGLMDALIFVDANILLDFYRVLSGGGGLELLDEDREDDADLENFNHALFAFAFFARRQDRELPGAISRGLLDCPRRV